MIAALLLTAALASAAPAPAPAAAKPPPPANRVASVFLSQDFVNELLAKHAKSDLLKELTVQLDAENGRVLLRGVLQVPVEELRAVNLDPKLGAFRFQVTIKPESAKDGRLILVFPLDETYFYPKDSDDPRHDRVIVPVQMLSLALASARGYLAALSGDFSGFDRRTKKLEALMKGLDRAIAAEKNADALDDLKTQRDALRLQIEAVPIERKQLQAAAKQVSGMIGFAGEKELNDDLAARKNALILKINLGQFVPYLKGLELSGVRAVRDRRDGDGSENFLALDLNAALEAPVPPPAPSTPTARVALKTPPSLIVRLNQALFESDEVLAAEKKDMGGRIRNFSVTMRDDGLHVAGEWKTPLLLVVPFDTIVDFVPSGVDRFDMKVRELKVAQLELEVLSGLVLESLKRRLDQSMKGVCSFEYVGVEADRSRALRVTVDPKALIPAFPDLHLVGVDTRDRELLLKIGRP